MLFAIICTDKPDHFEVRAENRPAHLEFLKGLGDTLKAGGPFLAENGDGMNGSLLIIEAETRAHVEAMVLGDPYAQAGLFASVDVRPWKWTVGVQHH